MQINLSDIENEKSLHELFASKLGFPDFYGKNWDAFWDAITALVKLPSDINIKGTEELKARLPAAHSQLKRSFDDMANEFPEIKCKVSWN